MRVIQTPTEAVFRDAYAIADAVKFQIDQETRLASALEREGILSNKATGLSNDIVRLSALITERIKSWEVNYGKATYYKWHQHLPDYRGRDKVLARVEQWEG